jgi:DNA-directed RNA polymerase subunit H (RpoH/RPB5)
MANTEELAALLKSSEILESTPLPNSKDVQVRVKAGKNTEKTIRAARHVFVKTLEMLEARGGYDVKKLLQSEKELETPAMFQLAMLSPDFGNPLRDVISSTFSRRAFPPLRVVMSILICNPEGKYTALFFPDKKSSSTQVSKRFVGIFFKALLRLRRAGIPVSEVILVSPAPLSSDAERSLTSIKSAYFVQNLKEEEVLVSPLSTDYGPLRIKIYTNEESIEFFKQSRDRNVTSITLQKISHADPVMRYLGARSNRVIEIVRAPLVPGGIRSEEFTYAHIF